MTTETSTVQLILDFRDNATAGVNSFRDRLNQTATSLRNAGLVLTGVAGAGAFAAVNFTQAALEQERAIRTLASAVNNSGSNFEDYRETILQTTAALQAKTNFGDEEQIRALQRLVPILGDTDAALAALPAVLDAAASSGSSVETVAGTLGRALAGAANTAESVGLTFDETADFSERLAIVLDTVGGAAEADVDPMIQLRNATGDLREAIGRGLIPLLLPLAERMVAITNNLIAWADANPRLIQTIALVTVAVGAAGLAMLALSVAMKAATIAATALSVALWLVTSPLGLIVLAIGATVAAIFIFRDKVPEAFAFVGKVIETWVKTYFAIFVNPVLESIKAIIGVFGQDLPDAVLDLERSIESGFNLEDKFRRAGEVTRDFAEGTIEQFNALWDVFTDGGVAAEDLAVNLDPNLKNALNETKLAAEETTVSTILLGDTFQFMTGGLQRDGIPTIQSTRNAVFDLNNAADRIILALRSYTESIGFNSAAHSRWVKEQLAGIKAAREASESTDLATRSARSYGSALQSLRDSARETAEAILEFASAAIVANNANLSGVPGGALGLGPPGVIGLGTGGGRTGSRVNPEDIIIITPEDIEARQPDPKGDINDRGDLGPRINVQVNIDGTSLTSAVGKIVKGNS